MKAVIALGVNIVLVLVAVGLGFSGIWLCPSIVVLSVLAYREEV